MKRILFLIIACVCICTLQLSAQTMKVNTPRVVEVGEQFRLSYEIKEKGSNIKLNIDPNFQVLMGPSTSSSYSTQIINGKRSTKSSYTYTYILLAKRTGKFKISPASITIKGKTIKSAYRNIEVVKARSRNRQQQTNNTRNINNTRRNKSINSSDIFVKVSLNKRSSYLGEHVVATLKVFTKVNLAGFGEIKFPSFEGFLSQEIPQAGQVSLSRTNVNGEIYNVGIIRKLLLFPQHTGNITIEPFEMECIVRQRVSNGRKTGFFDDFFDSYKNVKIPCKSKSVRINIKELPRTSISSFDGAVGKFKMYASIDKDSLKVNEAISLKVKISGNGNLKLIKALEFDFPSDFEVYDPTRNQAIKNSVQGTKGSISFKYLIIPRHEGDFNIPSTSFTYFDVKQKKYKTLKTPSYTIKVGKGDASQVSEIIASNFNKEDVRFIGKDIRYIKTNIIELQKKGSIFFASRIFFMSYLIPFIIFIIIYFINIKRIRENSDTIKQKNKKASKLALKRLKIANKKLLLRDKEEFYLELSKAMWTYISDKLNIPLSELSKENINTILESKNIDSQLIDEYNEILDICEFARYSPASASDQMDELFDKAKENIKKLESNIQK